MLSEDILYLPIRDLAQQIRTRKLSPVELAQSYLDRSEKLGPRFNAYVTLTPERALRQAQTAETEIAGGHYRGLLHGIPYAVKDLAAVKGYPTTWGAKPYASQSFDYDAAIIERLDRAGAVLIGKAAMIELAGGLGYSGPYASLTGPCRNPWDTNRWTCGSSSGSGAIMAAGLAAFALGSDTRGSITCPSAQCGISGMRPSFGRVSRYGAMAIAWSMDKLGPMARTADCCGIILAAISGHDPRDQQSLALPPLSYSALKLAQRPRIGRLTGVYPNANKEIHDAAEQAAQVLEKAGAKIEDAEFPDGPYEEAAELVILIEAASSFSKLIDSGKCAGLQDPLGQINGYISREFSATDYLQAQRVRATLQRKADELFHRFDVLLAPGQGGVASLIPNQDSPRPPRQRSRPPESRRPAESKPPDGVSSMCGLPAMVVPAGFSTQKLPIAVQFVGRALRDDNVIAAANLFQAHTDWHRQRPNLT
jgi:aspartyl-tRNA(Asn)/glutamyl-tRNA(Gln) amidotransferase subunit A